MRPARPPSGLSFASTSSNLSRPVLPLNCCPSASFFFFAFGATFLALGWRCGYGRAHTIPSCAFVTAYVTQTGGERIRYIY